ncbi:MAG TPA: hypothetical protein VKQ07_03570 [Jatrophihabitantaceae bacterium]|nr:hypothetical protein [Jatrophihabitantaceae bacterium]
MRGRSKRRVVAEARELTGDLTGCSVVEARALVAAAGARLHDISEYCSQKRCYVWVHVRVCDGRVAHVLSVA